MKRITKYPQAALCITIGVLLATSGCAGLNPAVYGKAKIDSEYVRKEPILVPDPATGENVILLGETSHHVKASGGAGDLQQIVGGTKEQWDQTAGTGSFETNIQGDQDLSGRVEAIANQNAAINEGLTGALGLIQAAFLADLQAQAAGQPSNWLEQITVILQGLSR